MKYLIILTILVTGISNAQENNTSVNARPLLPGFFPRSIPKIIFEYAPTTHSNIDKLNTPIYNNILGHKLSLKTRFKGRPLNRFILIDLPKIDGEYTPNHPERIRSLNIYNTLIGIYIPTRKLSFNSVVSVGYSDFISVNEDNLLLKSNFLSMGLNGGMNYSFTNKISLGMELRAKLQDYLKPSTAEDDFTYDNLKFTFKLAPKLRFNRAWQVITDLRYSKKLYRERLALTETGDTGGIQAETIDQYKFSLIPRFKNKGILFQPSIAYLIYKDMENNGRTYTGPVIDLKLGITLKEFKIDSRIGYRLQDYDTQLVDPTQETGDLLKNHLWSMENTLAYKFSKTLDIVPGYVYSKLISNKESYNYTDHSFKVGMNLTI